MTEETFTDNGSRALVIEGGIGVGKTTLSKKIAERAIATGAFDRVIIKPEPISPFMLDAYLENKKHYAPIFQHNILFKLLNIYRETEQELKKNRRLLVIIDRGLIGNLSFAEMQHKTKLFDDVDYKLYREEFNVDDGFEKKWAQHKQFVTIYLRCDPKVAFERMKKRGNPGEIKSYTPEYFKNLHEMHDKNLGGGNVPWIPWDNVQMDCNGDLENDAVDRILGNYLT